MAHQESVTVAFGELERFAARRVRAGRAAWSEQTAVTGNLCAARFEHDASRALDAQLHTHLVTANATYDAKTDRWFALTERQMLSAIRYAGKVYQNELARRVLAAGYEIEATRNARGVVEGFEIAGITAEERARASKRRAQIEKEIVAFAEKYGREPTMREVHAMTTATRDPKLAEITTADVRWRQRAEFVPDRAQAVDQLVSAARRRGPVVVDALPETQSLKQARDHLFERASVQHGHEILAEALNQSLGTVSLEKLKVALVEGRATDCIPLNQHVDELHAPFGTRAGLTQELEAIRFIDAGRGKGTPLGPSRFEPDPRLSVDQRSVVKSILASTDSVCALRGVAGTGKTTTLQEVQRGLRELNRDVIACAPMTSAAQELRAAGFADATTLEDFLQKSKTMRYGELARGTALIVDEAGIASTRQGAALVERVRDHNLRLILVGDTKQHSGVALGDRVLIRQNHRATGLVNGDVLTLACRLSSGDWVARDAHGRERQIPSDFGALTHGYAVTSHKAQGRTATEVIVCAAQLDTKSAYVAFSRGRQQATGYTPDKAALFNALPDTHTPRPSAVDFWTPERTDRLHWARRVIERVRQMFVPSVPPAELSVDLVPPVQKAIATETISPSRRSRVSHGQRYGSANSPRQGMRMSM